MPASRSFVMAGAIALALLPASLHAVPGPEDLLIVRVVDLTGRPVPDALITARRRDGRDRVQARTDADGTVRLSTAASHYIVDVEAPGYGIATRAVVVAASVSPLVVTLAPANVIEHVVVTASGDLQTAAEVSKAVTVVDDREMEARQEFSMPDALRTVPGLAVQSLGGPGAFTSIKIRGLREQDTAVLIDGVRFRDAASPQGDATAFLGEMYLTDADRLEVVRGSGSSLYGSHAVGGVVNLISRTGAGHAAVEGSAEAGALGFGRVRAHAGGAWGDRATFSGAGAYTRTADGVDGDDEARNTSVQGRADVSLPGSARATFRPYVSASSSMINESPSAIGPVPPARFVRADAGVTFTPSANDPDSWRDSQFASTLARIEQRLGSRTGYSASFHHLATKRAHFDGPLGATAFEPAIRTRSDFEGTLDTFNARVDREWRARSVTTVAYEYERDVYASRARPANPAAAWDARLLQRSQSVSVQQQIRFSAWQLAAGARTEHFSLDQPEFTPVDRAPFASARFAAPPSALTGDLSAAWTPRDATKTKIRAHAGNAYRTPSTFERVGVSFGSRGYSIFGDPGLGPERSFSVDAGVDQALAAGRIRASATWFHTRLNRVVTFASLDRATDPFGRSSGYRNADGRRSSGLELSAALEPLATTRVSAAYTFVDAPPPAGSTTGLPRAAAVPAHQFSLLTIHSVAHRLQLTLEVEAAGDHYVTLVDPVTFASRAYRFEPLLKADLAASWSLGAGRARVRLFAVADNLFDREYFVQGFHTAGRTLRAGLSARF